MWYNIFDSANLKSYTIFDCHNPKSYIWAKNIGLERLYELLSNPQAYYGYIGVNTISRNPEEGANTGAILYSDGTEWRNKSKYYTLEQCIKHYNMDLRRISLSYINQNEQTEEICIAAIQRRPAELYYVVDQTEEICKEAVRRDGKTLSIVRNKTEELVLLAIETEARWALHYTPEHLQTRNVCFEAAKKDIYAIGEIKNKDLRKEFTLIFKDKVA